LQDAAKPIDQAQFQAMTLIKMDDQVRFDEACPTAQTSLLVMSRMKADTTCPRGCRNIGETMAALL
jgi:hypothetical protein